MKHNIIISSLLAATALTFTSCDDEFTESNMESVEIVINYPSDIDNDEITDAFVTFRNISSGQSTEFRYPSSSQILYIIHI